MGYAYDSRGRLAGLSEPGIGPGGFAAEFGYATHSDLPQTTLSKAGGSPVLTGIRTYDDADRLTSLAYARPGNEVVTSHAYTLDDADRRTKATREDATAWHYGYNERDEVTSAVKRLPNGDPLAGWQQAFAYDHLGNRKWTREGGDTNGTNLRQLDYTANALNQYTQITRPGAFDVLGRAPSNVGVTVNDLPVVRQGGFWRAELDGLPNALASLWQSVSVDALDPGAGPGGADLPAHRFGHRFVPPALETPLYDSDGNLVSDARWTYAWDAENRLVEVRTGPAALAAGVPGERYRYVYDSRSRRIGRTVERWNPATQAWVPKTSERFVHDDWNVVAVVDAAGDLVQRYAWGNDLSGTPQGAGGVGGLLAAWDAVGNRAWCYAYDGNGNVSAVVDLADGTKVGRYDYDAFGRTIAQWGDEELCEANVYQFSTKPVDRTGFYYYGFRYYNPETGRWLSRDPVEEQGGMNLYGFVGNDGVNSIDYLGHEKIWEKILGLITVRTTAGLGFPFGIAQIPFGQQVNQQFNHFSTNDDEDEMVGLIGNNAIRTRYEIWLRELSPQNCEWESRAFSYDTAARHGSMYARMGTPFFDSGWWLAQSSSVEMRVEAEVRRSGNNRYEMRNIRSEWKWNDLIDANNYRNSLPQPDPETLVHYTIQPIAQFQFHIQISFEHSMSDTISIRASL